MPAPVPHSRTRDRLALRPAGVAALVDGEALAMFGVFGLTWAIPAAALRLGHALRATLRRRARHALPAA